MKIWAILNILIIIGLILFFIYREGEKKGKTEQIKKDQEREIKIQDEIIEENKRIIVDKNINKSVADNDVVVWLHQNRCKNC